VVPGFGTAVGPGAGWPASAPPSSPCGLSAVPGNSSRFPTRWLAVVAFPPRTRLSPLPVGDAFRRPFGTVQPSDFSCPFVISFFRSQRLPLVALATAEAKRSPRVRTQNFVQNRRHYVHPPDEYWASPGAAGSPRVCTPYGASLSFGSALRLRTSTRHPLAGGSATSPQLCPNPVLRIGALVVGVGFPPSGSPKDSLSSY
jgi:hypothetical protein